MELWDRLLGYCGGGRGFWEIAMNSGREGIMGENGELWACTE